MFMNKKFIVSNWKTAVVSVAQAEGILDSANDFLDSLGERKELSLVFCPPFIFLEEVEKILGTGHLEHMAELGAQDIALSDAPAQAGEISGEMLGRLGVRYVIVGHSERRWKLGESDELVNKKLRAVLIHEMVPIVCIGEREQTDDWKKFLEDQVLATFAGLTADEIKKCIIAYEPVWAISSTPGAKPDTPESAVGSIQVIEHVLSVQYSVPSIQFLYGGSVDPANISSFLKPTEVNGVLVGRASAEKGEFVRVLAAAAKAHMS